MAAIDCNIYVQTFGLMFVFNFLQFLFAKGVKTKSNKFDFNIVKNVCIFNIEKLFLKKQKLIQIANPQSIHLLLLDITTVKSRLYDIDGQHQLQRKIEIYRKIETFYVVILNFVIRLTYLRKFEI